MHCEEAGQPLVRFSHCQKSIYSFGVPARCPLCQRDVGLWKLEDAPVSIPNPFSNGHREKCAFLLRPTRGSFLRYRGVQCDLAQVGHRTLLPQCGLLRERAPGAGGGCQLLSLGVTASNTCTT